MKHASRINLFTAVIFAWGSLVCTGWGQIKEFVPVTEQHLSNPDPGDWLMPSRTRDWHRFSPLDQINRDNVKQLTLVWARGLEPGVQENIPLVYKGIMYVAHPGDVVQALDATSGDLLWEYRRPEPEDMTGFATFRSVTRSLAIYDDMIFHGTGDGHVIALDARNGELRWERKMLDYRDGSNHSSGFTVADGKVLSGRSCSTTPCFIAAHDAQTGKELWRTYTAAAPGEPGGDTWGDLPFESRIHASPWGNPGSYDPERQLVYWGTADPRPYPRVVRHHGNPDAVSRSSPAELYSNSTLALDVKTGKIVWYYQHLPGDDWDADHVQERILIDTPVAPDPKVVKWINPRISPGERRDILITLGEPGGLWALDRETGEFLWANPFPFDVPEFHLSDIDEKTGQTFINWNKVAKSVGETHVVCFHNTKGFWPMAYNPRNNSLYIPYNDYCLEQTANADTPVGAGPRFTRPRPGADPNALSGLARVDASTGQIDRLYTQRAPSNGAVLATAGNLVFWGDLNRRFRAFDADTGEVLWETILGDSIENSTITYAVNGKQYLAVLTGWANITGTTLSYLPEVRVLGGHNTIYVFALSD
jgi:PQQ-dependent dehydrogenase (methanol/ethanol family)